MLTSLIAAFSMYSRIPMPDIKWDKDNAKYSMCFFPFVGLVIGGLSIGAYYLLSCLGIGKNLLSAILTAIPFMITGGIHMDGYLDTVDARSSCKSKEEKLKILKDPHAGAFAIIYGVLYLLLYFGLIGEITEKEIVFVGMGYIYSRILSAISVVTFHKAKKDGMLATTANQAEKNVKKILFAELGVCMLGMLCMNPMYGIICILAGIESFFYYKRMAYKVFGGTTGDLAGYFLQVCEGMLLMVLVIAKIILNLEGINL